MTTWTLSSPPRRRSVLYVPGANARALAKAPDLDADAVILDLEDAVSPGAKDAARSAVCAALAGHAFAGRECAVRVNGMDTPWFAADMDRVCDVAPGAIVLPKVSAVDQVLAVDALLARVEHRHVALWLMIETPAALLHAEALARACDRVQVLVLGLNDLAAELRIRAQPERDVMGPYLAHAVLAARAAGVAVLDGVVNDLHDLAVVAAECAQSAAMGFDGKTLIHPSHIAAANAAFSPTPDQIAHAQAVIDAWEAAGRGGLAVLHGRMIERMHVDQARRVLAEAPRPRPGAG